MKAKIKAGTDPWKSAWELWLQDPLSSLDFKPTPFTHVIRGAYAAGEKGGRELSDSANAANNHVMQWYVSGDEAHAIKAIEIFDAWSGTLADFFENDAMLLDNVAVDPDAQGSGLGRLMLEYAEQAARAAGYPAIRLYTNEAMTENISLYSRIGYTETHRAEEKGLKRVYMVKALS